jgi:hypothetical protein
MPYRPRQGRDRERMLAAMRAARAQSRSAMDAALAQIGAAFGEAAAINHFKIRVERHLRRGPDDAAVRARFSGRAAMLAGRGLDAAIVLAERWWRDERKAFQIASALGFGNRLSLDVLRELRLILRLMRFRRMQAEFGAIVASLCDEAVAIAAE